MYTGIEPEFMLLERQPDGSIAPFDKTDTLDKPCYDYKGLARASGFIEKLVDSLQKAGLDIYQIDHEDANGQFEVNFKYSDCLNTADNFTLFKMAASEIARSMGMICTFMPKPFSDRAGTGSHFHISMGSAKQKNLFHDPKDKRGMGLSKLAYQFLAGILHHAHGLTALAAPSINSYKRLVVGRALSGATWAPAYVAYGDNNRTAMVRIPGDRLELRLPDGSCNAYLTTAAIIAAGLDGIERNLGRAEQHQPVRPLPGAARGAGRPDPAAEPVLRARRLRRGPRAARRDRREPRAGVHQAEADGVDRLFAQRLPLGNRPLPRILLNREPYVWNRRIAGEEPRAARPAGRAHDAHADRHDRARARIRGARRVHCADRG